LHVERLEAALAMTAPLRSFALARVFASRDSVVNHPPSLARVPRFRLYPIDKMRRRAEL